jgi:hypothetical protein
METNHVMSPAKVLTALKRLQRLFSDARKLFRPREEFPCNIYDVDLEWKRKIRAWQRIAPGAIKDARKRLLATGFKFPYSWLTVDYIGKVVVVDVGGFDSWCFENPEYHQLEKVLREIEAAILRLKAEKKQVMQTISLTPDNPDVYILKSVVAKTFGITPRQVDGFLERHKEVKAKRPLCKSGKEHPRHQIIDIVAFTKAIQHDNLIANSKATGKRIRDNLQRLKMVKESEDACLKYMGIN